MKPKNCGEKEVGEPIFGAASVSDRQQVLVSELILHIRSVEEELFF